MIQAPNRSREAIDRNSIDTINKATAYVLEYKDMDIIYGNGACV